MNASSTAVILFAIFYGNYFLESEQFPLDWSRGLIFPLFKGGPPEARSETGKYRGITLLSIIDKTYTSILNDRISSWVERNGILNDEQAGFRKGRSTVDQVFILTEIIINRRPAKSYVAFLDVAKAYDRVWRDGLWSKLYNAGVNGKMWRILKNIYRRVESSVLLGHKRTIFFLIEVGLRQGCLLSPILFDLFINDLSKVINALEKGVKCGNRDVSNLFFADDIAVIADSKEDLEVILQTIYDFSLKWRFKFNIDKCSVVVFDDKRHDSLSVGDCKSECKCNHHFRFGPFLIQQVLMYKYLGVELDNRLTYSFFKHRMLQKARMNVGRVWHMGIRNNLVSVKGGMSMYEALVSSILEFSCITWAKGDWRDAETLQRNMFKKILKCSVMTTGETVLGDLGRWQLRARRDFLVLQYWFQLISCPDSRLLKQAYLMSKSFANVKKRNFASRCKSILFKYNLREQLIYNLDGKNNNESKTISSHKHFFENYMTKIIQGMKSVIGENVCIRSVNFVRIDTSSGIYVSKIILILLIVKVDL